MFLKRAVCKKHSGTTWPGRLSGLKCCWLNMRSKTFEDFDKTRLFDRIVNHDNSSVFSLLAEIS